jgi:transposase
MRSNRDILESRMQGNLARPVWGWGPGEIPGPTPLFCGSDSGGRTAAVLFSFTASAKRHGLDPFAWLRDVLAKLPLLAAAGTLSDDLLNPLLPDRWQPAA